MTKVYYYKHLMCFDSSEVLLQAIFSFTSTIEASKT